jgi:hypothetical protein
MYYGASLGRVGLDFRGVLVPIFEKAIYNLFVNNLSSCVTYFTESIRTFKFVAPTHQAHSNTPALESKDQISPPTSLLDYPPVAILANGFLAAFNELRFVK